MDEILSVALCLRVRRGTAPAQACDERVELAAEADAKGRVEEGCDQGERRRRQPHCGRSERETDGAGNGEEESDELGELQRRDGLLLGYGTESRSDERREELAVRVLARAAVRTDGEHDGLQPEDDRGRGRTECRGCERGQNDDGGDPGGKARPADVDLVWSGVLARHENAPDVVNDGSWRRPQGAAPSAA